jgi:hypothetical protein
VAVTATSLSTATVQTPVPVHAPPHPRNTEELSGVGVRVTCRPSGYEELHAVGQWMPLGVLDTTPAPVPDTDTVSTCDPDGTHVMVTTFVPSATSNAT